MMRTYTIAGTKLAIANIGRELTARHTDGEWRVSINVEALKLICGYSHAKAMERNEALAAYVTDAQEAIDAAKALHAYVVNGGTAL